MLKFHNEHELIQEKFNYDIHSTVKYYTERIPEHERDDWNATDFLPHYEKYLQADYSYRTLCYTLARKDILQSIRLYEKLSMAELYEWYSISLATDYRPPKKRG